MSQTITLQAGAKEADITKALASLKDGGTIIFPPGETIAISKGLYVDVSHRDITINLNGSTLVQAGNSQILAAYGAHEPFSNISLGSDGAGNATATYSSLPTGLKVGDWIKVTADDPLPGDHIDPGDNGNPTRLGQAAQVLSIRGNTVTLAGGLTFQSNYQTNVRATAYDSGHFALENGTLKGAGANSGNLNNLLQLRTTIGAEVSGITLSDGYGAGINVADSVGAKIDNIRAYDFNTVTGGAIHTGASLNTVVTRVYAENMREGVNSNSVGTPLNWKDASQYGGDVGLNVSNSVVVGAVQGAYGTHSEVEGAVYDNVLAFNSGFFAGIRGDYNTFSNSAGDGNNRGIQFYEYGDGDAKYNLVDNVTLRNTTGFTFVISNSPQSNVVSNSTFESVGTGYNVLSSMVQMVGSTLTQGVTKVDDNLVGTIGSDKLLGGVGLDTINGAGGDDFIWGGAGADLLTGGSGSDHFAYLYLSEGGDTITDFRPGQGGDVVDVSMLAAHYRWNPTSLLADHHIQFVQLGGSTQVYASQAGDGTRTLLATLQGVTASQLTAANLLGTLDLPSVKSQASTVAADPAISALAVTAATPALSVAAAVPQPVAPVTREGTAFADKLYSSGGNVLYGRDGNDQLWGKSDMDSLYGGNGSDTLNGGDGAELLSGEADNDVLTAGTGHDTLLGGDGNDKLFGGAQGSLLDGGAGNDALTSRGGGDTMRGGAGNDVFTSVGRDVIDGGDGDDIITISATPQSLDGGAGNDAVRITGTVSFAAGSVQNVETFGLVDGVSADFSGVGYGIYAFTQSVAGGTDMVIGTAFADKLQGGLGADLLDGGAGNDTLYGKAGRDVFRFDRGFGKDTVADFVTGDDKLRFTAGTFSSYADVMGHAAQVRGDTVLTLDATDTVTLKNTSLQSLSASQFLFG